MDTFIKDVPNTVSEAFEAIKNYDFDKVIEIL
jgi:hypothetical protein